MTVDRTTKILEDYDEHIYKKDFLYSLVVNLSSKSVSHERKVYALLDMIGDLGGFSDAIVISFSLLLGNYSPNLFFKSVIKAVFRVDTDDYEPQNKRHKRRQRRRENSRQPVSPEVQLKMALKHTDSQTSGVSLVGDHLSTILKKL